VPNELGAKIDSKTLSVIKRTAEDSTQYYWLDTGEFGDKYQEYKLVPLCSQSTLAEAYLALHELRCGGVYIYEEDHENIVGLITFEQIRQYLLAGKI